MSRALFLPNDRRESIGSIRQRAIQENPVAIATIIAMYI